MQHGRVFAQPLSDFEVGDQLREQHSDLLQQDVPTSEESFMKRHKGKLAAGVLALGALGTAGYIYRDELKRFFQFGQFANEAVEDSSQLVIAKLQLALNLCQQDKVDLKEVKLLLKQARNEARSLANVNQRLQQQLAQVANAQPV